jgi:predicted ATP-dependent endonuclease of OLD family
VKLIKATVKKFRSVNEPQTIDIDKAATVLVGMNEAGKTVFLKALSKSVNAIGDDEFDVVEDYPRKDLTNYQKRHATNPDIVTVLQYEIDKADAEGINEELGTELEAGFKFTVDHLYDNSRKIGIQFDEKPVVGQLSKMAGLSGDAAAAIKSAKTLREAETKLKAMELTEADKAILERLTRRIAATKWDNVPSWEVWRQLDGLIPKFMYFSDYDILPGKMNMAELAQRLQQAKDAPASGDTHLKAQHKAVLALLRMADVSPTELTDSAGYEEMKAKIEAVSISLTDQVMEYWKQNEDLEVEVDIKPDPKDEVPYNNGPNLYLRIKNRRHRGVSTPFDQRSRGFIWFFSFLVWFDSVQHQLSRGKASSEVPLILLLDEPGLALHALAQEDFLRYIDTLAEKHQVIYTTHSPFMLHSDRLEQVRVVEDKDKIGTTLSSNLSGSDPRTIFPLQAALGWTLAQNLFISKKNLIVEGPSELAYLQTVSGLLEAEGGTGLRSDVTIVPVGGMSNVSTFVSLLGSNNLKFSVLHDYNGASDQKLDDLVRQKLLAAKSVLNVSQFRDLTKLNQNTIASDIEDLFEPAMYLDYFNKTFSKQLGGVVVAEDDLGPGHRIVGRLEKYLIDQAIKLRPSGGFNHYAVAAAFAAAPPAALSDDTKARFNAMFDALNKLY